ncbi:putative snf2 family helicase protein [Venturia nashicola]|nr:putative snf2 family helicase protein [Venturia nashicola]
MSFPNGKKRIYDTAALTRSSPPPPQRPVKSVRYDNQASGSWRRDQLRAEGSSSQAGPAQSQASQFRHEEDGGNELIDDIDAFYGDDIDCLYELYGSINSKIVGVQYYRGHVTFGEMVLLNREPTNQYDSNAIQVKNVSGVQIGHIPRQVAAKLAPFMDSRKLLCEAETTGPKGGYDVPISIKLLGTNDPSARAMLKEEMKAAHLPVEELLRQEREEKAREQARLKAKKEQEKLIKAAKKAGMSMPGSQGQSVFREGTGNFAGGSFQAAVPNLADIIKESVRFNPRNVDRMVEQFGMKDDDLANMDKADQPATVQTQLLPYQLQGLKWLLSKENPVIPAFRSKNVVQLWQRYERDPNMLTNVASNFSVQSATLKLASGGILADDMGLGKTLQMISLIMADRESSHQKQGVSGASLILAPLSVMSNWSQQMEKHVKPEHALRVLTYHGPKREKLDLKTIGNYDVVITTYETMMSEFFATKTPVPRASGLFSITWRRLILDEGHQIRNPRTKKAVAACELLAQSRWVLTGTPIVNTLKDLFSLVKFLGLSGGLDKYEIFNAALIRPVTQGSEQGSRILQILMRDICLRRRKDMSFIDLKLPELSIYVHRVDFLPHEDEMYKSLKAEAEGTLKEYRTQAATAGVNASKEYRFLLEILLRMRQVCNHSKLCGEGRIKALPDLGNNVMLDLTPENKKLLQEMLQLNIDSQEDCPGLESVNKLVRPAAQAPEIEIDPNESSSKVEALLSILAASRKKDPATKTVVFSQWTRFLDVIQVQLEKHGFKFVRIDGSMPPLARDASLSALDNDPECTIMLASLAVCSVGLNLVAANQAILSDTWWAPAIEHQAIDRIHRLGQKKETTVFRLVMNGSIEERVLDIQEEKTKLMNLAFAEKPSGKKGKKGTTSTVAQIERLLSGGKSAASA